MSDIERDVLLAIASQEMTVTELSNMIQEKEEKIKDVCETLYNQGLIDFRRGGLPYQYCITEMGKMEIESGE